LHNPSSKEPEKRRRNCIKRRNLPQTWQSELLNPMQHPMRCPVVKAYTLVSMNFIFPYNTYGLATKNIMLNKRKCEVNKHSQVLTSLFLKAKMIAPACSAALPTIGSKIMLRKLTDKPHESDASSIVSTTYSDNKAMNTVIPISQAMPLQSPITACSSSEPLLSSSSS